MVGDAAKGDLERLRAALTALASSQQLALRLVTTDETAVWESLCAAALPSLDPDVVQGLRTHVTLPLDRFVAARDRDRLALQERRLDLLDQMLDEAEFSRHEHHRHLVDQRLGEVRTRLKALRAVAGLVERVDEHRRGRPVKSDVLVKVQEHETLQREIAQLEAESARVANICARHRRARIQIHDVEDELRRAGDGALQDARRALATELLGRGAELEGLFDPRAPAGLIAHRVRGLQARRTLVVRVGERVAEALVELTSIADRLGANETFVRSAGAAVWMQARPRIERLLGAGEGALDAALHAAIDDRVPVGAGDEGWWAALVPDPSAFDEAPETLVLQRAPLPPPSASPLTVDLRALPVATPADVLPRGEVGGSAVDTTFLPSMSGVFTNAPAQGPTVRAQQRGAFARGTQLGRYVVEGLIGKGGMAEVYLASQRGHADFHKRVVLKRMATDVRDVDDIDRMFAREAQTAARLSHPNVVQIFDYQCVDGEAFIVMEHLDGLSLLKLSTLMRAAGRELPVPAVLRVVADAARGLHAAHTHADERGQPSGLIHRDISPDNLFLTSSGFTKVLDFGIAKRDDLTTLTGKNELKGKIPYMPPEQIHSEPLDARADLFSLGATAYFLLCGQRPFVGANEVAILHAVLTKPAPPPSTHRRDVPADVESFVLALLEKDRNDRPPSAAIVARRCEELGAASHEDAADLLASLR